mgnify:CR=1 FL=1|tara:strand:- start:172 stop:765 length:594 start_codon:yes stop_codon:yes gene_type:complete
MILGHKKPMPGMDAYYFGDFEDGQKQFVRVCAGLALAALAKSEGSVVVIGEMLRAAGPQDFTLLAAAGGEWAQIENALVQYRRDLKFSHLITEPHKDARQMLWRMPALNYGSGEIPLATYEVPKYALEETGRQRIEKLIVEGRLHLDSARAEADESEEASSRAIMCAVNWMMDSPPFYASNQQKRAPLRAVWGQQGL